jgi:hypothetical protein
MDAKGETAIFRDRKTITDWAVYAKVAVFLNTFKGIEIAFT